MIGSIILFSIALYFIIFKKTKGLLVIFLISLINDLFKLNIGFSLPVHYFISILYAPKLLIHYGFVSPKVRKILSPLFLEFFYVVILAIIFGLIFPWRSAFDYQRTWTQLAEGKVLTQTFRLIAEFGLLFLILYWLHTKKITITYLLKVTAITISLTVLFAIVDIYFNLGLKFLIFPDARDLGIRFTGLNGEPRVLGRTSSLVLLLLLSFYKTHKTLSIKMGLLFSAVGVIISLSASAYLFTLIWGFIFILIIGRIKYVFYIAPFLIGALVYLWGNDFFEQETQRKIEMVVGLDNEKSYLNTERVNSNEPALFRRFEVFDRAALNFLYEHPIYFISGTGPNLISIPASPYLTNTARIIYGDKIDSVPHTFLINLISRSGIIGLTLWLIFFFRFSHELKYLEKEKYALGLCLLICHFILFASFFFLIAGILLYIIQKAETENEIST